MCDTIGIVIVDDHPLVRHGLQNLFEAQTKDIKVLGLAANGEEAITLCERVRPDVVLMDIRMPGPIDGLGASRVLEQTHPEMKILILTTFDEDECIFESLEVGVTGYLLKDMAWEEMAGAIRAAYRGEATMSPRVTAKVMRRFARAPQQAIPQKQEPCEVENHVNDEHLSTRDQEILTLIGQGLDNGTIATTLCISEKTVRNYVARIYQRIGVHDRARAVLWAIKNGFVEKDK